VHGLTPLHLLCAHRNMSALFLIAVKYCDLPRVKQELKTG